MARHGRELEVIKDNYNLFKHVNRKTDAYLWTIGDTTYTVYGVSHEGARYICDVSDRMLDPADDAKVRFILDKDIEILEIHYILPEQRHEKRCRRCAGIRFKEKETDKGWTTFCVDCGVEQYNVI